MLSVFNQVPIREEWYISQITHRELAKRLGSLGIFESKQISIIKMFNGPKPVWLRGRFDNLILSGPMSAGLVVESYNQRYISSLSQMVPGQNYFLHSFVNFDDLENIFLYRHWSVGETLFFVSFLPQVNLITLANNQEEKIAFDDACRIWGKVSFQEIQLSAALINQPFEVTKVFNPTLNRLHFENIETSTIYPGDRLIIRRLEPIENFLGSVRAFLLKADNLEIVLPKEIAKHFVLQRCPICWSCGQCK
jgi:hypothetical protein